MRFYNEIKDGIRTRFNVTRKSVRVGENSPDELMNSMDLYLCSDSGAPQYNQDTHKIAIIITVIITL